MYVMRSICFTYTGCFEKSRPMSFPKSEEFLNRFEYFFHNCKLQFIPNILISRT